MELKAIKPTNGALSSFGCICKYPMVMDAPVMEHFYMGAIDKINTPGFPQGNLFSGTAS